MSSKPLSFPISFEVQAPTCPVITDESVLDAIGNTPLIRIHNIGKEFKNVDIYAKAEWKNAGGSVKSRPALKMIDDVASIEQCGVKSLAANSRINCQIEIKKLPLNRKKCKQIHMGKKK